MKLRKFVPLLIFAAIVAGGYAIDQARAAQRSRLSGFFESQPTRVASRIGGRVATLFVKEGEVVRKGQRLAVLEAEATALQTEAQRLLARQSAKASEEAIHGPRAQEIALQQAARDEAAASLERLTNGPLPEELAAARERVVQARARYDAALEGPRPQERAQALAAEQQARAALDAARRGPTPEERGQAQARLEAASADEHLARSDALRSQRLFEKGAVSGRDRDAAVTRMRTSEAQRKEAENALRRAQLGTPKEELAEAEAAYRQAKARLDLANEGTRAQDIQAARADLGIARQNLRLLERGTRAEDLRAARARLAGAQAALDVLKAGTRPERIAQAGAAAGASRASAESAGQLLAEREVVAPCDGIVERLLVAKGDLLAAGTPVIQLADPVDIWLRVYLPERQLAKVKVGDDAAIRLDGVSGTLAGYVESIATQGEFTPANLQTPDDRGKQVFAIRIRLKSPDPRAKAGMYATVVAVGRWR